MSIFEFSAEEPEERDDLWFQVFRPTKTKYLAHCRLHRVDFAAEFGAHMNHPEVPEPVHVHRLFRSAADHRLRQHHHDAKVRLVSLLHAGAKRFVNQVRQLRHGRRRRRKS